MFSATFALVVDSGIFPPITPINRKVLHKRTDEESNHERNASNRE